MSYGLMCDGCDRVITTSGEPWKVDSSSDVWTIEVPADFTRRRDTIHLHNEQCLLPWLKKAKTEREKAKGGRIIGTAMTNG